MNPAHRSKKSAALTVQYRQLWTLLALMLFGVIISIVMADTDWLITKGLMCGSILAFLAQLAFTIMAYQTTSVRHARQIMLNTYLGMVIKWVISIAGFALIFLMLKPIHSLSVLIGFLVMQLSQAVGLLRLK